MGRVTTHQIRLPRIPSNLALDAVRDGAFAASHSSLCQHLTTLWVKNFFLISNLDLPFFSLKSFKVLQVGPHKGRAEGDNHFPLPSATLCQCSPG